MSGKPPHHGSARAIAPTRVRRFKALRARAAHWRRPAGSRCPLPPKPVRCAAQGKAPLWCDALPRAGNPPGPQACRAWAARRAARCHHKRRRSAAPPFACLMRRGYAGQSPWAWRSPGAAALPHAADALAAACGRKQLRQSIRNPFRHPIRHSKHHKPPGWPWRPALRQLATQRCPTTARGALAAADTRTRPGSMWPAPAGGGTACLEAASALA